MKSSTINLMLATATLLVASTVASAQSLTAEIPFQFVAAGKTMPPGKYEVTSSNGETFFRMTNVQVKDAVMFTAGGLRDPQKSWQSGQGGILQFACSEGCVLRQVWTNRGYPAYAIGPQSNPGDGKPTALAVIRLTTSRSK